MNVRAWKRETCLKAIRHLDLQGKSPEEIIMLAWTDGWEHALDVCLKLEQELDRDVLATPPEFTDGRLPHSTPIAGGDPCASTLDPVQEELGV